MGWHCSRCQWYSSEPLPLWNVPLVGELDGKQDEWGLEETRKVNGNVGKVEILNKMTVQHFSEGLNQVREQPCYA